MRSLGKTPQTPQSPPYDNWCKMRRKLGLKSTEIGSLECPLPRRRLHRSKKPAATSRKCCASNTLRIGESKFVPPDADRLSAGTDAAGMPQTTMRIYGASVILLLSEYALVPAGGPTQVCMIRSLCRRRWQHSKLRHCARLLQSHREGC